VTEQPESSVDTGGIMVMIAHRPPGSAAAIRVAAEALPLGDDSVAAAATAARAR
jgi:hypothetical protein